MWPSFVKHQRFYIFCSLRKKLFAYTDAIDEYVVFSTVSISSETNRAKHKLCFSTETIFVLNSHDPTPDFEKWRMKIGAMTKKINFYYNLKKLLYKKKTITDFETSHIF